MKPEHPNHRTLYFTPKQAITMADLDEVLPGETVQIRIGSNDPITYKVLERDLCNSAGGCIGQVMLALRLSWPRWDAWLDARIICNLKQTNVARISLMGETRIDHYSKIPGLGPRDFALNAQTRPTRGRLVHTPLQTA